MYVAALIGGRGRESMGEGGERGGGGGEVRVKGEGGREYTVYL